MRMRNTIATLLLVSAAALAGVPGNHITLTNNTGATVNQPYTISRFFAKGEVPNYPKPVGISQWQSDVKTRWRDSSASFSVSAATNTTPIHITVTADHTFMDGDYVVLSGLGGGNTAANGKYLIRKVSARGFDLVGSVGNGTYTSGGVVKGPALGSVQHALISFWKSTPNGISEQVAFTNSVNQCYLGGPSECYAAALTKTGMANFAGGNWGAAMTASAQGAATSYTKDAKAFIAADKFSYWVRGPIATTIIAEDRTAARSEDFGWRCGPTYRMQVSTTDDTITTYDYATGANIVPHGWLNGQVVVTAVLPGGVGVLGTNSNSRYVRNATDTTFKLSTTATGATIDFTTAGSGSQYITSCGRGTYDTNTWTDDTAYRPLHPQFILTFFPGWNGVYVEYVMQNGWSTAIADQRYTITLKKDASNLTTVDSRTIPQFARTEWVYRAWSGTPTVLEFPETTKVHTATFTSPNFVIDLNRQYIIYSRMVGQMDPTLTVSASNSNVALNITRYSEAYTGNEPYWCGDHPGTTTPHAYKSMTPCYNWNTDMDDPGGRGELSLIPRWYANYLYTFNYQHFYSMIGNADIMGSAPYHIWEGDSSATRYYDMAHTLPAYGKPLSVNARPTYRIYMQDSGLDFAGIATGDLFGYLQPLPSTYSRPSYFMSKSYTWKPEYSQGDPAHQGALHFVPYMMTGDYFYLQEGLAFVSNYIASAIIGNRHNDWGVSTYGMSRGTTWTHRSIYQAALMAPDGTPEKGYFLEKGNITTESLEAEFGITDGHFAKSCDPETFNTATETSVYCWTRFAKEGIGPDSNIWHIPALRYDNDPTKAMVDGLVGTNSIFQAALPGLVYGWTSDVGFKTDRISRKVGTMLTEMLMSSPYPRDTESYNLPLAPYRPASALLHDITATQLDIPLAAAPTWNLTPPYFVLIYSLNSAGDHISGGSTNGNEYVMVCGMYDATTLRVCPGGRGTMRASVSSGVLGAARIHFGDGRLAAPGETTSSSVGPDWSGSPYYHSLAEFWQHQALADRALPLPFGPQMNYDYFPYPLLNIHSLAGADKLFTHEGHSGFDAFMKLKGYRDNPATAGGGYTYNTGQNTQEMFLPRRDPVSRVRVEVGSTFVIIHYLAPSAGFSDAPCTVDGVDDGQSGKRERVVVKTGKNPSTVYISTIHCNADYYDNGAGLGNTSVTYETSAAVSGSATFSLLLGSGSSTAYLDYGSTSSLGSTVSASCSTGCTLSASVPRGLPLYYRIRRTQNGPTNITVVK